MRSLATHTHVSDDLRGASDAVVAAAVSEPTAEQWMRVKARLRSELGEDVFSSWFARVELVSADQYTIHLSVPTQFLRSWIQSHYRDKLLALWTAERSSVRRIELQVRGAARVKLPQKPELAAISASGASPLPVAAPSLRRMPEAPGGLGGSPVDPRFTFATFCEGSANRVAFAAARAVAE